MSDPQEEVQLKRLINLSKLLEKRPAPKKFPDPETPISQTRSIASLYIELENELNRQIHELFREEVFIHYPLEYAADPHEKFVNKYLDGPKHVLFIGLNPGPFGMCQTGVPFGDVQMVKEYLKIEGQVNPPERQIGNKKILGFNSECKEISGRRFWSYFQTHFGAAENFFRNAFIRNLLPVAFTANNKNVTPEEIKDPKMKIIEGIVINTLYEIVKLLEVKTIIAIGRYPEKISKKMIKKFELNLEVLYLLHPSPRSSMSANWPSKANAFMEVNNLQRHFVPPSSTN